MKLSHVGKRGGTSIPPFSPSYFNSSCTATRLFISVTRMVIGADGVTSHWGEMELKICPDGQNKGFGQKSGKRRKEGGAKGKDGAVVVMVLVVEAENRMGGDWNKKKQKNNKEMDNRRCWRSLLCILLFFYGQSCHHRRRFPGMNCWPKTPNSASSNQKYEQWLYSIKLGSWLSSDFALNDCGPDGWESTTHAHVPVFWSAVLKLQKKKPCVSEWEDRALSACV